MSNNSTYFPITVSKNLSLSIWEVCFCVTERERREMVEEERKRIRFIVPAFWPPYFLPSMCWNLKLEKNIFHVFVQYFDLIAFSSLIFRLDTRKRNKILKFNFVPFHFFVLEWNENPGTGGQFSTNQHDLSLLWINNVDANKKLWANHLYFFILFL